MRIKVGWVFNPSPNADRTHGIKSHATFCFAVVLAVGWVFNPSSNADRTHPFYVKMEPQSYDLRTPKLASRHLIVYISTTHSNLRSKNIKILVVFNRTRYDPNRTGYGLVNFYL